MDAVSVVVENWPTGRTLLDYVPVAIAVIALLVSLYSVYLTRKSFIVSQRSCVWAASHAVPDESRQTLAPVPHRMAFRVRNVPARVARMTMEILQDSESLFERSSTDMVRFPDERSELTHSVSEQEFERLMDRPNEEQRRPQRVVSLTYASLDGGRGCKYKLRQV